MTATAGPVFMWASVGTPDNPPDRFEVERCNDCAALVPSAAFDQHGRWHRDLERAGVITGR